MAASPETCSECRQSFLHEALFPVSAREANGQPEGEYGRLGDCAEQPMSRGKVMLDAVMESSEPGRPAPMLEPGTERRNVLHKVNQNCK